VTRDVGLRAQLRASGVLIQDVAIVDRLRVGRPLNVFVAVEPDKPNHALLRQFENKMAAAGDIMAWACYEVSGEFAFLLVVKPASLEAHHAFTREAFPSADNVRNFKSMFATNWPRFETRFPLSLPR
jgi:Lrp/AsnC family leucine-responsive transcriptional regulator